MKRKAALAALALAVAFALGYATSSAFRPRPIATTAPAKPLLDEVAEIVARHAREDETIHAMPITDQQKAERFDEVRRLRRDSVRAAYQRRGVPCPGD